MILSVEWPVDFWSGREGRNTHTHAYTGTEDIALRDTRPPEDGGVEQHPVYDDDQEDLQPEDFEQEIDAASKGGFDTTDKYEMEHKAGRKLREPGKV